MTEEGLTWLVIPLLLLLVSIVGGGGGGHGRVGGAAAAAASVVSLVAVVAGVRLGDDSSSVQSLPCSPRRDCNCGYWW